MSQSVVMKWQQNDFNNSSSRVIRIVDNTGTPVTTTPLIQHSSLLGVPFKGRVQTQMSQDMHHLGTVRSWALLLLLLLAQHLPFQSICHRPHQIDPPQIRHQTDRLSPN